MITVADKLSHRHGISMLFSDARFRVINLQFKRDGEGGGGGLRESHRVNTIKRKETLPQNNPNFNFGVISEDQSFLYLCWRFYTS